MANSSSDPGWQEYQRRSDAENLRTLVVLHRVYAGFTGLGSCCLAAYLSLILGVFGFAAASQPKDAPPAGFFVLFGGVWGIALVAIFSLSILNLLCANWLRDRRTWVGVIVVSALNCLSGVLGIGLGVYTLIVVNRPTVKSQFEDSGR